MPAGSKKPRAGGIPTLVIESKPFGKDRAGFEAVLQSALEQHRIELICLGGFMRLLTAEFVQRWYGRMLNIHPSLLPSFPGLEPQAQALRAGVKISGATVHFVIPETDAGPILMQGAVAVSDDDTPETLARAHPCDRTPHLSRGAAAGRRRPDPDRGRYLQDGRRRRVRRYLDFARHRLGFSRRVMWRKSRWSSASSGLANAGS